MKKYILIASAIILLAAGCNQKNANNSAKPQLQKYSDQYQTEFEGYATKFSYDFSYPGDIYEVSKFNRGAELKNKQSGQTHKIYFLSNDAIGVSEAAGMWDAVRLCSDCKSESPVVQPQSAKDVIGYGNNNEDWIVFGFQTGKDYAAVEMSKGDANISQVISTLSVSSTVTPPSGSQNLPQGEKNGWNSYTSPTKYGFSIKYPKDFGFNTDISKIRPFSYIPACDDTTVACAFLTKDKYQGTNFDSAGVSVNILKDLNTQGKCYNFNVATNEAQKDAGIVKINSVDFHSATGGGAATGHSDMVKVYRNFHNNTCYEIMSRVGQTSIDNYPEGTVKSFNENEVWNKLEQVVSTFEFASADNLSNWKTYKDNKNGIEFKYPETWKNRGDSLVGSNEEKMISLSVENTDYSNVDTWFAKLSSNKEPGLAVDFVKKTNIGGVGWVEYSYKESIGGCLTEYSTVKNGKLFTLERGPVTCDLNSEFDSLFASFKFTK